MWNRILTSIFKTADESGIWWILWGKQNQISIHLLMNRWTSPVLPRLKISESQIKEKSKGLTKIKPFKIKYIVSCVKYNKDMTWPSYWFFFATCVYFSFHFECNKFLFPFLYITATKMYNWTYSSKIVCKQLARVHFWRIAAYGDSTESEKCKVFS